MPAPTRAPAASRSVVDGCAIEVLKAFVKLRGTSFGGPVAHIGYFHTELVDRRNWLDDKSFSDLVAWCQFLPGPPSSQVRIALGFGRPGWLGAVDNAASPSA
ncbi:MAG: hypothetical protein NVS2B4_03480 [Ramlibacter sp.]